MIDEWRRIARRQLGLIATWQLRRLGWTHNAVLHLVSDLRRVFDGVHLTGDAPLTAHTRLLAATLTTPTTVLASESAAVAYGIRRERPGPITVLRPGSGGPVTLDGLLVRRSVLCAPDGALRDTTTFGGIPITTVERTIADLWPRLPDDTERHKLVREAIRLRRTSTRRLAAHLDTAPARNAPKALAELLDRYALLQLDRCRSDAEARAMELILAAGLPLPEVNVHRAGEEADLSWAAHRLIIEIDGGSFHTDKAADARKTDIWTAAHWRVRRVPSEVVFTEPGRFVAGVRHHLDAA